MILILSMRDHAGYTFPPSSQSFSKNSTEVRQNWKVSSEVIRPLERSMWWGSEVSERTVGRPPMRTAGRLLVRRVERLLVRRV